MVEIRKAYPTDAYILVGIRDKAWKHEYYDILPSEIISDNSRKVQEDVRHLEDQIRENNRILVAVDENVIVGFVFYAKTQGEHYDNAEIREIYVLDEYQHKGIGRKLFEGAVDCLKKLRYSSFIVSCPIQNKHINFFFHLGGVKKGSKVEKINNCPVSCDVIYFEIKAEVKDNTSWNKLFMLAQDRLGLLNSLNPEVAVILTDTGNMYLGLGIRNKVCPIESALSNMYLSKDVHASKILILNKNGTPVLPCGKCRDLLISLGQEKALIMYDLDFHTMSMKELNPYYKDEERV